MAANLKPDLTIDAGQDSVAELTRDFAAYFSEQLQLPGSLAELKRRYRLAQPFPHLVIDNLFSQSMLDALPAEMTRLKNEQWVRIETDSVQKVDRMRSGMDLGPAGTRLTNLIHSAPFLYLLSEITGVWQLLPDPYLQGAGYASMQRGDLFQIHSDRSVAYDTGLKRRLAMIVFLNKNWRSEYHGELELWDHEAKGACVKIEPLFNRTVFFEVANPNYHGVPTPLECPANVSRQSFITYYHTSGRDENATIKPHTSLFAPGIYRKKRSVLKTLVSELTPPVLLRAAKRLV